MRRVKYIKTLSIIAFCAIAFTTSNICIDKVVAEPAAQVANISTVNKQEGTISPLTVVNNPKAYLNQTITMNAKFDKFATLGLDYKPAFKSSEEYISFLIKRDDTTHDIPLSEMKLFLKRNVAEKFIELKTDDEISITGTVFSDALGDAWIDVTNLVITKKAPKKDGV